MNDAVKQILREYTTAKQYELIHRESVVYAAQTAMWLCALFVAVLFALRTYGFEVLFFEWAFVGGMIATGCTAVCYHLATLRALEVRGEIERTQAQLEGYMKALDNVEI